MCTCVYLIFNLALFLNHNGLSSLSASSCLPYPHSFTSLSYSPNSAGFFFSFYLQCSPVCAAQLLLEKGAFHKIWSTYLRSDQQLLYKSILCQVSTRVIQYVTKYLFCFNKREIFPITSHPKGAEASSYVLWQFNIYLIYFELSEQNTRNRIS